MKKPLLYLSMLALLLSLVGCPPPGGGAHYLNGRLFDPATGGPVAGATVTFSGKSATTASDGTFRVELPSGTGTVTGPFSAVAAGRVAWVADSFSAVVDSTLADLPLQLSNSSAYTTHSVTVVVKKQNGTEIPSGAYVQVSFGSSTGGFRGYDGDHYVTGGLVFSTPTFGSDCLVAASAYYSEGFTALAHHVDLSAPATTVTLTEDPLTTTPVTVTASAVNNSGAVTLCTSYGPVELAPSMDFSSSVTTTMPVANPWGDPVYWAQSQELASWQGSTSTRHLDSSSSPVPVTSSVTLPSLAVAAALGPIFAPNADTESASIAYNTASGTLSISPVPGATWYMFIIADGAGFQAVAFSSTGSIVLPASLRAAFAGKTMPVMVCLGDLAGISLASVFDYVSSKFDYDCDPPNRQEAYLFPDAGGFYSNSVTF
ncbi:MAG TPA: carboxypeptidase-like regulatory domain-containing protein [Spirochaetia bacterium]|nr:carboxypeptidase-like regulatory domain-containing protein [Spirochaetia bacterium]